ncbi:MAG: 3-deoxy-D-manno-octulosonic acid transferase [Crocinitomicaceae bacterium]|nr:3-deoxy-D-manno-octulosonic acid transferase [Crocinitomicaceae bacterium]
MRPIYTFFVRLYSWVVWLLSFRNAKAKKWIEGRKHPTWKKHSFSNENWHWFHCASLGEFDLALPLMDALKEQDPKLKILVTFFSPSGMDFYHKRNHRADFFSYLPVDTISNARAFLHHVQPKAAFFIKYEFWYNHLNEAKKRNIPLYSVSANFRANQTFFKWYGWNSRKTLNLFTHIFVQYEASKVLLNRIGIQQVSVAGDLRFDRVMQNKSKANSNEILTQFKGDSTLWIIGSSWPKDEELLFAEIAHFKGKVLLAPHDIKETHLQEIENGLNSDYVRYTEFGKYTNEKVLILDTIGHLMNAYQYGDFAYIGGGFSGNLHNTLEPAAFGLPVIFGPKHTKFPEAQRFIDEGLGFSISNANELNAVIHKIQTHTDLKTKITAYMESNTGVLKRILEKL